MQPEVHDIGIDTCSVGVITEPECLGPCEPGTSVTLEGIVWHETENGENSTHLCKNSLYYSITLQHNLRERKKKIIYKNPCFQED